MQSDNIIDNKQDHILKLQQRITKLEATLSERQALLSNPSIYPDDQGSAESASYMTEEKYSVLIENANDAVLVAQDNKLAFFNQRTVELTGYLAEELRRLQFIELIHPDDRAMVVTRYQKRLLGEEVPDVYTFQAVKENGDLFWVEIHAVRIQWLNRPAVLCFLTDISQHKSTEAHLIESEQRYRNIVELSPYGIITLDTRGVITSVNSAFVTLTGYERDDFVGHHISRIPTIHLNDIPRFVRLFAQLIKDGFEKPLEFDWTHKDGSERWGEARGVLIRSGKKVQGLQGIIRDITEQKRAALLLEALNRTALAVAQATKPQEIFNVMGKELRQIGIACAVLMSRHEGRSLLPAYVSYNSRAIRFLERLVREKTENYIIDVAKVDVFQQVVWNRDTVIASDPLSGARQILPASLQNAASQLIHLLDIKASINAPLIIDDQVIGMLSVQSDVLRDQDVPAITAFANLTAAALHKARLLEQAQSELLERKKAESEIWRLQRLLQNITDSMPSALITLDLHGRVLTANPAANFLLTRQVLIEPGIVLWHIDPVFELYKDLFEEVVRTLKIVTRHQVQITTPEAILFINIDAFPLVVDSLKGVVLRIDDVTEYVKLQDAMLQSAKLASVGGLAAGVAHEINNPLAAMIQSAQMIQQTLDVGNKRTEKRMGEAGLNPPELKQYIDDRHILEYVEGIREAGGRAAKIVSDLLAFSRKSPSTMTAVNINEVVEAALDLAAKDYNLMQHFDFRDIEIVRSLDTNIPLLVCDKQQIQQVVLNLLRNASQALVTEYDKHQNFRPRITLRSTENNGNVRLMIEDNGAGIDETVMEHIFEPFFTTKQVGEGSGLGLWLCWSIIVERHHGQIWAETVPEGGVRFNIELPLGLEVSL